MLKKPLQKNLVELLSKKFYFFNFKFTKAKFLQNTFWHNLIVYLFRADTGSNRKIAKNC